MYRFPKPQPLSPNRKYLEENGSLYRTYKGRKTKLSGTYYYNSIYYWWYQYLRCSDKYRVACGKNGRGMQRIYNYFGDIYQYADTPQGFRKWWIAKMEGEDCTRGEYVFGIRSTAQAEMQDFVGVEDLDEVLSSVVDGSVKMIAVPTHLDKKIIARRFQRLLAKIDVKKETTRARCHPESSKVDAVSLDKALLVWKMKFQQGMQHAAIAAELMENPRFAPRRRIDEDGAPISFDYDSRNTVIVRLWKKRRRTLKLWNVVSFLWVTDFGGLRIAVLVYLKTKCCCRYQYTPYGKPM